MQFRPLVPGVEIRGLAVELTIAGFRIVPSVMLRYLVKHGVLKDKDTRLDPEAWYSQAAWLKVFEDIYQQVGPNSTFEMGRQIGAAYPVPPEARGLVALTKFLDTGYHLAHRLNGRPMFDPPTGVLAEGIGHYACRVTPGANEVVLHCDNPYPCDFDLGLINGVAKRNDPSARVDHAAGPCRKQGGESCSYAVRW